MKDLNSRMDRLHLSNLIFPRTLYSLHHCVSVNLLVWELWNYSVWLLVQSLCDWNFEGKKIIETSFSRGSVPAGSKDTDSLNFLCTAVIANGLFKQLCLRMFPQLSRVARVMELNKCGAKEPVEVGSSYSTEWESLARDHRVYATLARVCTSFLPEDCISKAISASSTDNYPEESIENTLQPADIFPHRPLYWSSKGQENPAVPETLIYKLKSEFCVITEIKIRPFEGMRQHFCKLYALPVCLDLLNIF